MRNTILFIVAIVILDSCSPKISGNLQNDNNNSISNTNSVETNSIENHEKDSQLSNDNINAVSGTQMQDIVPAKNTN